MRILIVDDHRIVASGCRALFADDPDIDILEASDAESGERAFEQQHPDVCVLDINLPTVSSPSCPVLKAPWETTPDYFYGCGLTAAWRTSPLSLWEVVQRGPRTQQLAEVLQVITIGGLVAWLAADGRRSRARLATHIGLERVSLPEGV